MFCKNCGRELDDNDKFCEVCGTPVQMNTEQPPFTQPAVRRYQKYTGLLVGVVSAVGMVVIIALFVTVLVKNMQAVNQNNNSLTSPYKSWQNGDDSYDPYEDDESDDGDYEYDTDDNDLEDFF